MHTARPAPSPHPHVRPATPANPQPATEMPQSAPPNPPAAFPAALKPFACPAEKNGHAMTAIIHPASTAEPAITPETIP